MSEPRLISPMLDKFAMGGPISDHNGVRCCPAMEEDTDQKFIVKIISIPASRTQLDALLLSGAYADESAAQAYFKELADGVIDEIQILDRLSHLEGFIGYDKWQLVPMEEEVGYDVYLLGAYKRTLARHFMKQPMTHLGALNLGLDLCASLSVCRRSGYLYVDLKPSNVFVTQDQTYRIGDLGFLRLDSLKYASLPEKYRSQYTAPEIADAFSSLNTTMDVYAVGLILYQTFNNGDLPFTGDVAPAEAFPAPAYADYEMSEIILKACAPDPADRWEDPMQLGQALVSYMQRNGANDTPIVPPAVPVEEAAEEADLPVDEEQDASEVPAQEAPQDTAVEEAEETADVLTEAETSDETSPYEEDDFGNLTFLLDANGDETDPAYAEGQIDYNGVSAETSEILAQADEIASHPVPDPVIPPEPIDVPIPEPIQLEEPKENTGEEQDTGGPEAEQPEENDALAEDEPAEVPVKKKKRHWLRNTLLVLLVAAILAVGVYYYSNYYLLPIEAIVLNGDEDTLTVQITSDIDEALLTVICSDPHGNQIPSPVVNGTATFTNLVPDTAYTVKVVAAGFHRLTGDTAKAYSTPMQSSIVQFSAVTGAEDGSVILGFTVDGPDSEQWTVAYSAAGEDEKTVSFPSHMATITGLTVGKEYTFRLIPDSELYVTGTDEITHTASKLIYAENLMVTGCLDGKLTVAWSAPADSAVESWSVRCYNDNGYNETVIVSQNTAEFTVPNDRDAYTVEVTAAGMSVNQRVYVPKDSVTLSQFHNESTQTKATVSWQSSQQVGEDGWLVSYTVNGVALSETVTCMENAVTIPHLVPGAEYTVTVKLSDGTDVLGGIYTFTTAAAETFTSDYAGSTLTPDDLTFYMCRTPDWSGWDRYDLADSDYTTEFSVSEKASFLVHAEKSYGYSDDTIETLFVITDSDGKLISVSSSTQSWDNMWYRYYCEMDIPALPSEPGQYMIYVYFNGRLANEDAFTITG